VIGGGVGEDPRRVGHEHAALAAGVEIDVVHPHAVRGHVPQPPRRREEGLVHGVQVSEDHHLGLGHRREEFLAARLRPHRAHLELGGKLRRDKPRQGA